eukprot:FR734886.1.p1 GENE.FR734886.1~~FR734886.1.p1  ORF type:complete len:159 (+),score=14.16 FR734886.1:3-479(+)
MPDDSICHLFHLSQNAVVKSEQPYIRPSDGRSFPSENFVEVLVRMHEVLAKVCDRVKTLPTSDSGKRPLVCMYGHSMAGAALGVLTGNGKQVDGESCLGFDGKYILPNATPVILAKGEAPTEKAPTAKAPVEAGPVYDGDGKGSLRSLLLKSNLTPKI